MSADEIADLIRLTPKGRCSAWKWVRDDQGRIVRPRIEHDGARLTHVSADNEVQAERIVRAVLRAERNAHARRSNGAKKAANTRAMRKQRQVYAIVDRLVGGGALQPSNSCRLCGRGLDDPEAIARGIGSECWQAVLEAIRRSCEKEATR